MVRVSLLTATGLAAVLTFGSITAAAAAGDGSTSSGDDVVSRLTICDRMPARIARVEKVQARLHAGPETRGSVAFLQDRIERANAAGDADRARLLSERMAVRKEIDSSLPTILAHLKNAQTICAEGRASAP